LQVLGIIAWFDGRLVTFELSEVLKTRMYASSARAFSANQASGNPLRSFALLHELSNWTHGQTKVAFQETRL